MYIEFRIHFFLELGVTLFKLKLLPVHNTVFTV